MVLSKREKLLIAGLAALVVATVFYFLISQIFSYQRDLAQEISRHEFLLNKARVLAASLGPAAAPRSAPQNANRSLIGYLERVAAQQGLKERVQLNRVPIDKAKGVEGIDVKLNELSLDDVVRFIYEIENSRPPLVIDQLEITESFRTKKKLRLNVRVLGQT